MSEDDWERGVIGWLTTAAASAAGRVTLACPNGHDIVPVRLTYSDDRGLRVESDTISLVSESDEVVAVDDDDLNYAADKLLHSRVTTRREDQLDDVAKFLMLMPENDHSQVWSCPQTGCDATGIEATRKNIVRAYMEAATRGKKKSRLRG